MGSFICCADYISKVRVSQSLVQKFCLTCTPQLEIEKWCLFHFLYGKKNNLPLIIGLKLSLLLNFSTDLASMWKKSCCIWTRFETENKLVLFSVTSRVFSEVTLCSKSLVFFASTSTSSIASAFVFPPSEFIAVDAKASWGLFVDVYMHLLDGL